ncbi:poly-gamma-glutamate hydrolase family protein [Bacillus sp. AF23]
MAEDSRPAGTDPENIANRNRTGKSIQLVLSTGLRKAMFNKFNLFDRYVSQNEQFY